MQEYIFFKMLYLFLLFYVHLQIARATRSAAACVPCCISGFSRIAMVPSGIFLYCYLHFVLKFQTYNYLRNVNEPSYFSYWIKRTSQITKNSNSTWTTVLYLKRNTFCELSPTRPLVTVVYRTDKTPLLNNILSQFNQINAFAMSSNHTVLLPSHLCLQHRMSVAFWFFVLHVTAIHFSSVCYVNLDNFTSRFYILYPHKGDKWFRTQWWQTFLSFHMLSF